MRPTLNRAMRLFAYLRAKLTMAWWIPCPVCGQKFAEFERSKYGVNYKMESGGCWSCQLVCSDVDCREEANKQATAWYKKKLGVSKW